MNAVFILLVPAGLIVLYGVMMHNRLLKDRNTIDGAWSGVVLRVHRTGVLRDRDCRPAGAAAALDLVPRLSVELRFHVGIILGLVRAPPAGAGGSFRPAG